MKVELSSICTKFPLGHSILQNHINKTTTMINKYCTKLSKLIFHLNIPPKPIKHESAHVLQRKNIQKFHSYKL